MDISDLTATISFNGNGRDRNLWRLNFQDTRHSNENRPSIDGLGVGWHMSTRLQGVIFRNTTVLIFITMRTQMSYTIQVILGLTGGLLVLGTLSSACRTSCVRFCQDWVEGKRCFIIRTLLQYPAALFHLFAISFTILRATNLNLLQLIRSYHFTNFSQHVSTNVFIIRC
jgi:hypothetical protein